MITSRLLQFFFLVLTLFSTSNSAYHDEAVNYWKSFYPTIPIPSLISQHISKMSDNEINTVISLIREKTAWPNVALICKTAGLICSTNEIPKDLLASLKAVSQLYMNPPGGHMPSQITVEEALGIFLHESSLKKGTQFNMGGIKRDLTPAKAFLPHSIASLLSLKQSGVLFQNTTVKDMMSMTIDICNSHTPKVITKCPSSVEELVHLSAEVFPDKKLKVLYPKSADGEHKTVLLDNIRPLLHENRNAKFLACHGIFFPYTIMYCHATSDAQVYRVDLVDPKTLEKINDGMVAVCHRNTEKWSPTHVAFTALKIVPGKGTICHWMSTESIAFVHLDDTLVG